MKKRAMKKWIPKNTVYCYEHLERINRDSWGMKYVGHCKWRVRKKHKPDEYGIEEEWFCKYLGRFDSELGCGLLWDACKECGEHYDDERYANKCAKWRYKHRDYIAKIEAEWRNRYERNQDA